MLIASGTDNLEELLPGEIKEGILIETATNKPMLVRKGYYFREEPYIGPVSVKCDEYSSALQTLLKFWKDKEYRGYLKDLVALKSLRDTGYSVDDLIAVVRRQDNQKATENVYCQEETVS